MPSVPSLQPLWARISPLVERWGVHGQVGTSPVRTFPPSPSSPPLPQPPQSQQRAASRKADAATLQGLHSPGDHLCGSGPESRRAPGTSACRETGLLSEIPNGTRVPTHPLEPTHAGRHGGQPVRRDQGVCAEAVMAEPALRKGSRMCLDVPLPRVDRAVNTPGCEEGRGGAVHVPDRRPPPPSGASGASQRAPTAEYLLLPRNGSRQRLDRSIIHRERGPVIAKPNRSRLRQRARR